MYPLRIYLIGAGAVAHMHAEALQTLPPEEHIHLAVADPSSEALAVFTQAYPQARAFTNAQEMLAEPASERDIVIVATPPFTHFELTCAALETRRHVLCEKPLAINTVQAVQMLATARKVGRLLGCCSSRSLGAPLGQKLHELVQEQALGELYHLRFIDCTQRFRPGIEIQVESPWFIKQARSGGGVLMNLGPYDITFLNDLLQPERVEVLAAWMSNPTMNGKFQPDTESDVEQHLGATLRYTLPTGAKVMASYERAACTYGKPEVTMELVGLKGSVRWGWFMWSKQANLTYTFEQDGQLTNQTTTFESQGAVPTMSRPLNYFYHHLCGQPSLAIINERAVFNFACLQAMYQCARSGEAQVIDMQHIAEGLATT